MTPCTILAGLSVTGFWVNRFFEKPGQRDCRDDWSGSKQSTSDVGEHVGRFHWSLPAGSGSSPQTWVDKTQKMTTGILSYDAHLHAFIFPRWA